MRVKMSQQTERRPILAALLTFIQPGLGHLYLREWIRAAIWAGMWLATLVVVTTATGGTLALVDVLIAVLGPVVTVDRFPVEAVVAVMTVTTIAMFDVYWLAIRNNRRLRKHVARCPNCGKDLDPSLDFCHWCTVPLDGETSS